MKVFVFEFASAYASINKTVTSSILCEGLAMLKTLLKDFVKAGYQVTTVLSPSLIKFKVLKEVGNVEVVSSQGLSLKELVETHDFYASYIIAPESSGVLEEKVSLLTDNCLSLNCSVEAIKNVRNKMNFYRKIRRGKVNTPFTEFIKNPSDTLEAMKVLKEFNLPLVLKPVEGVGCSGIQVVKSKSQIKLALKKLKKEEIYKKGVVVQEFIKGINASVSLISNGSKIIPLTLNYQFLNLGGPNSSSIYKGGLTPLHVNSQKEALENVSKTIKLFKGLRGYVGVDLVLTKDASFIVEINPRLTTSYVGVSKVLDANTPRLIMDAVLKKKLPMKIETHGFTYFLKLKVPYNFSNEILKSRLEGVEVPPMPLFEGEKSNYVLITGYGEGRREARNNLLRVKKKIETFLGG